MYRKFNTEGYTINHTIHVNNEAVNLVYFDIVDMILFMWLMITHLKEHT